MSGQKTWRWIAWCVAGCLLMLPAFAAAEPPYPAPPVAPVNHIIPGIKGSPTVGHVLTASTGVWTGTNPILYSYQWERCHPACAVIPGATSSHYTLTNADLGAELAVAVTAENAAGSLSVISPEVGLVVNPLPSVAHQDGERGCSGPSVRRSPANPLIIPAHAGPDPLQGATFFVDGPTHGAAAGAIARLLGIDRSTPNGRFLKSFPDNESWVRFVTTTVAERIGREPASVQRKIRLLEKIASQPEAQRVSAYSDGGTPRGVARFVNKLFCGNLTADPNSVPIITTYFMHPALGGCPTTAQIHRAMPLFKRRINALVRATGRHRVVYLLELDVVGSSSCMAHHGSLRAWERMLKYEVDRMATLPHAVVYVEGGYSDANTPRYAARILNAADIRRIRGFYTNDTHINWTINEIRYGNAISRMTHGAHFIVNTAENGNGPKLNRDRVKNGNEDLCNPPGRGLGPRDTTSVTGYPRVDALLWTFVPGNSSGPCHGGTPSGTFWTQRAISLAAHANDRLGPSFPSRPY